MRERDREIQLAVGAERARCLWCADQVLAELRAGLDKKVLVESEIHVIKVKVQIAEAIVAKLRRAIFTGAKPKSKQDGNQEEGGPPLPDQAGAR